VSAPWFEGGVTFRCEGVSCGNCCSGKKGSGRVWLAEAEMHRLAAFLKLDFDAFTRRYVRGVGLRYSLLERPNSDCVFYVPDQGCTVYAARPNQCRTYPFWPAVMASPETWDAEKAACPGIDCGERHSSERVESLFAVADSAEIYEE
jgi:Fe-S-cluster containining protein